MYDPEHDDAAEYAVKVLDLDTQELPIYYERLLRDIDSLANRTLPCEIVRADHPVLVMPKLTSTDAGCIALDHVRPLTPLIRTFRQLGVEYIHALHIPHLDLCWGNVVTATPRMAASHSGVIAWIWYIIDFDTSRQFTLPLGCQPPITLPLAETHIEPPGGLTIFDPYSWDVYCLGRLLERTMQASDAPLHK
ncbi:hypothetical protein BV20DRAFT_1056776 [Pilatotrama ljubarskyi]|nr:hypothetical protein BV20DRAFT_1056776 [Pilatotrama ljubarskyi]